MAGASTTVQNKKEFLECLSEAHGVITEAVRLANIRFGMGRQTYYNWREEDPEFVKEADHIIHEESVDFAESKLFKLMEDGNPTGIIFFLKTKGKGRGYVERQEIAGVEGQPLVVAGSWVPPKDDTGSE